MIAIASTNCEVCGATTDWTPEMAIDIRKLGGKVECPTCRRKAMKPWPILYWGTPLPSRDPTGTLVSMFVGLLAGKLPDVQPQHCVKRDVPRADRDELARALAGGQVLESFYGYANCRICGIELGSKDMTGWGFMWPEKAEHYILEHDVWTPSCSRMLVAVRST